MLALRRGLQPLNSLLFPGVLLVAVLIWYLSDTVNSDNWHVHVNAIWLAMPAVVLAALTNWAWHWLPRNVLFASAVAYGYVVVSVIVYAGVTPIIAQGFQDVSPTIREAVVLSVRMLMMWSGFLAASLFLIRHFSPQRRFLRYGLLLASVASSLALLFAAIYSAPG